MCVAGEAWSHATNNRIILSLAPDGQRQARLVKSASKPPGVASYAVVTAGIRRPGAGTAAGSTAVRGSAAGAPSLAPRSVAIGGGVTSPQQPQGSVVTGYAASVQGGGRGDVPAASPTTLAAPSPTIVAGHDASTAPVTAHAPVGHGGLKRALDSAGEGSARVDDRGDKRRALDEPSSDEIDYQ